MTRLVSIIIPTKNRCELLRDTLASVRAQTYPWWETIVVDDGSTDGTSEMVAQLNAKDHRIRFSQRAGNRTGANVCRNQGLSTASGEFIIFLDSDDLLAPFCLAERLEFIVPRPSLKFAVFLCEAFSITPGDVCHYHSVDTGENELDRFLRLDVPWQTTSPMWRRQALVDLGPWDETLPSWQDWDFHVRALCAGFAYQRQNRRDCYWRLPSKSGHSIGGHTHDDPVHLRATVELLVKTHNNLQESGLMTPHRRRLLAGLFFVVAGRFGVAQGLLREQSRAWRRARQLGLISATDFRVGQLALTVFTQRAGAWRARQALLPLLARRFPQFRPRPAPSPIH